MIIRSFFFSFLSSSFSFALQTNTYWRKIAGASHMNARWIFNGPGKWNGYRLATNVVSPQSFAATPNAVATDVWDWVGFFDVVVVAVPFLLAFQCDVFRQSAGRCFCHSSICVIVFVAASSVCGYICRRCVAPHIGAAHTCQGTKRACVCVLDNTDVILRRRQPTMDANGIALG